MQRSQDTYTTQLQTNIIKVLLGERSGDKADKETEREKRESAEKEEREKSSVSSKFAGCCLLDSKVVVLASGWPAGKLHYCGIMNTWHHLTHISYRLCVEWIAPNMKSLFELVNVSPEAGLSKLICCLCTVSLLCVMFVFKVSSLGFTYFHLKHTSHSLSPLCAAPPREKKASTRSWFPSHSWLIFQPPYAEPST